MYNDHSAGNFGHGSLFVGCPISKSGFATNNQIDPVPEDYGQCCGCPHCFDYFKCRYALDYLKIPDDAQVVEVKKDSMGIICAVVYETGGKRVEGSLPKRVYGAKTIVELWDGLDNPAMATFYNIKTHYYVRIHRNPRDQINKYGKLYGKFSKDRYSFPSSMESSKEIFGYYKKEWICVWSRRG